MVPSSSPNQYSCVMRGPKFVATMLKPAAARPSTSSQAIAGDKSPDSRACAMAAAVAGWRVLMYQNAAMLCKYQLGPSCAASRLVAASLEPIKFAAKCYPKIGTLQCWYTTSSHSARLPIARNCWPQAGGSAHRLQRKGALHYVAHAYLFSATAQCHKACASLSFRGLH